MPTASCTSVSTEFVPVGHLGHRRTRSSRGGRKHDQFFVDVSTVLQHSAKADDSEEILLEHDHLKLNVEQEEQPEVTLEPSSPSSSSTSCADSSEDSTDSSDSEDVEVKSSIHKSPIVSPLFPPGDVSTEEGESGEESSASEDVEQTPVVTSDLTSKKSTKRVQFDFDAITHFQICPYAEVYGIHPRFFDFDRNYHMVPSQGFPNQSTSFNNDDCEASDSDEDSDEGEWEAWDMSKDVESGAIFVE
jgi:hypothetical protein